MHRCTDSYLDNRDIWITDSSSRKGREATRSSPTPRLTSSLPRASPRPTTPQPEIQRPQTPLVLQRNHNQIRPQHGPEKNLGQTWTKSHFVSKLRQNSSTAQLISNGKEGASPVIQSWLPKPPNITIQDPEDNGGPQRSPGFLHTCSPSKGSTGIIPDGQHTRPRTPTKKTTGDGLAQSPGAMKLNANEKLEKRGNTSVKVQSRTLQVPNVVPPSYILSNTNERKCKTDSGGEEEKRERDVLYTPSPLSRAQEAILYKSLEEEILSNLQQLSIDSDTNSSSDKILGETSQRSREISHKIASSKKSSFENHNQTAHLHSSGRGASFDAVIAELSSTQRKMEKVSIEKWVTTLPAGLTGKVQDDHDGSSHLKVSKPSMTRSWSSLGSSLDSKETGELMKVSVDGQNVERKLTPKKQRSSSLKLRRSLKRPERVPSIYKLKLRPCVQPRRDHRSDRIPSKIPKPVFYKKISCKDGTSHRQRENDFPNETLSSENSHGNTWTKPKSEIQSAKKCQRTNQESHANHDLESWV